MSYDLEVYSCLNPGAHLARLAKQRGLERQQSAYSLGDDTWQVLFNAANEVEVEDVPPAVMRELAGIKYLTEVNIEGDANARIVANAVGLAKELAKASHGVVVDPQEDTVTTPRGVKRIDLTGPAKEEELTLSWWFGDAEAFAKNGCRRLVDALEKYAPEALPKRYGLWEPPQFKYAEKGREHFIPFLRQHLRDVLVWYPSRPFTHVHLAIPETVGGSAQGYKSCIFSMDLQARALDAPGWAVGLRRLLVAVAEVVLPFYAEIRYGESPIRAWFWSGVPRLGLAALIGPPYDKLWPEFVARSQPLPGNHWIMETLEKKEPLALAPPQRIAQPEQRKPFQPGMQLPSFLQSDKIRYPKTWPFAAPFVKEA